MKLLTDSLRGFRVKALDGFPGKICDFYFDYTSWNLTHLSISLKEIMFSSSSCRLIPIEKVQKINFEEKTIQLNLLKHQINNGPSLSPKQPITDGFYESYWQEYYAVPDRPKSIKFMGPLSPVHFEIKKKLESGLRYYPLKSLNGFKLKGINGEMGICSGTVIDCNNLYVKSIIFKESGKIWPTKKKINIQYLRKIDWKEEVIYFEINQSITSSLNKFSASNRAAEIGPNVEMDYNGNTKVSSKVKSISPTP
jgi:hypothetical protein